MILTEEDFIEFKAYKELSYIYLDNGTVELYVNGEYVGDMIVWEDSEQDCREYLTINYEIVYLDTMIKMG